VKSTSINLVTETAPGWEKAKDPIF